MGFGAILAGMAVVVGLFLFHVSNIAAIDPLNADLLHKNDAAYKMREIAENRVFGLFRVISLDDFFDRDEVRQSMSGIAARFVQARDEIDRDSLSQTERHALDKLLKAVRVSQPIIDGTMDMAVDEQWSPTVQAKIIESTENFANVRSALINFVQQVDTETAKRLAVIELRRERETKLIPVLGVVVFFVSLGIGRVWWRG